MIISASEQYEHEKQIYNNQLPQNRDIMSMYLVRPAPFTEVLRATWKVNIKKSKIMRWKSSKKVPLRLHRQKICPEMQIPDCWKAKLYQEQESEQDRSLERP